MNRVRLAIASLLLGAAALAAPTVTHADDHVVHAQDIGWGAAAPSPDTTTAPAPTNSTNDIGWG